MGCDYIPSQVHFKGRLISVYVCGQGGRLHVVSARVKKGAPLDLQEDSENWVKLNKLVRRNQQVRADFQRAEAHP